MQDWNHSSLKIFVHRNLNDQGFIQQIDTSDMGKVLWNEFQRKPQLCNTLVSPTPVFMRWSGRSIVVYKTAVLLIVV